MDFKRKVGLTLAIGGLIGSLYFINKKNMELEKRFINEAICAVICPIGAYLMLNKRKSDNLQYQSQNDQSNTRSDDNPPKKYVDRRSIRYGDYEDNRDLSDRRQIHIHLPPRQNNPRNPPLINP